MTWKPIVRFAFGAALAGLLSASAGSAQAENLVLPVDGRLTAEDLERLLPKIVSDGSPLLFFAEDVSADHIVTGVDLDMAVVKIRTDPRRRRQILDEIAELTGGQVINDTRLLSRLGLDQLGRGRAEIVHDDDGKELLRITNLAGDRVIDLSLLEVEYLPLNGRDGRADLDASDEAAAGVIHCWPRDVEGRKGDCVQMQGFALAEAQGNCSDAPIADGPCPKQDLVAVCDMTVTRVAGKVLEYHFYRGFDGIEEFCDSLYRAKLRWVDR